MNTLARRFYAWAQHWSFYLLLAMPAIFLPTQGSSGIRGTWYLLGWPIEVFSVKVTLPSLFFDLGELVVGVPLGILMVLIAKQIWKVHLWAAARADWLGTLVRSWMAGCYCILLVFFITGWAALLWEWWLTPMNWRDLESAMRFGMAWLPTSYVFLALSALCLMFADYRRCQGPAKILYLLPVTCLLLSFRLFAYGCVSQLDSMNESAAYCHAQQAATKGSGITTR